MKAGRDVDVPSEVLMVLAWFPRFSAALPSVAGWNVEATPTIGNSQSISEELVLAQIWDKERGFTFNMTSHSAYPRESSNMLTKSGMVEWITCTPRGQGSGDV